MSGRELEGLRSSAKLDGVNARRWILVGLAAVLVAAGSYALTLALRRDAGPAPRVADVAARIGCSTSKLDAELELYARESGSCGIGAHRYSIAVFAGNEQRDQWLEVAVSFGGSYVVGDRFVVTVDSVDVGRELAPKLNARVA